MRATNSVATRRRRKKVLKRASGYWGHRHIGYKVARQSVFKADSYAYRDRKNRKRDFRRLWITRLSAAFKQFDLTYSKGIYYLKKANISMNRKALSELAINNPEVFSKIINEQVKPLIPEGT
ncbi:50S ribosomal protein L20 [Candidatus Mycoplasma haematolamae str. Purdue]|uniref:Large ribosomal subunit protein bL20 n=1 Tax=Mycoplasma haematolamae (strain Purdue) TaxID=1212765 RepID=I7C6X4_MYCHA|nr:50S ribosomal protein L20 [Candidatus Mycoplasma haematolamae]AFO52302.1 50S ribosomal protein L20 [Candidatus Mycoplasma haematolamae str. Purdue]